MAAQYYAYDQAVIESGLPVINREEPVIDQHTGVKGWLLTTKVPLRDSQGHITGLVGMGRDITELKRAEEELKQYRDHLEELVKERTAELTTAVTGTKRLNQQLHQAKEAAEAANQAKSDFLARMSHELQTLLNGILGYTQILTRDTGLTHKQQEAIDIIHGSGEHLLMMSNDMLDLARIEARKIDLESTAFDLPACVHSISNMFHVRARNKGVVFTTEITPDLPAVVQGDEKRLRQILLNLLGNAIKFTEEGNVILRIANCELRNEPTPYPSQEGKSEIRNLKFEIQDTGIGIPSEHLEQSMEGNV